MNHKRKRASTQNSDINSSQTLSIALNYFAGASPSDLIISHGVGYNAVYDSVWDIVNAINSCDKLKIKFPNHDQQQFSASQFKRKSDVGFDNCIGCIDGLLIWTNCPTKNY